MNHSNKILDKHQGHFKRIDESLKEVLSSKVPLIEEIVAHTLSGRGKRLRPLFFVLSCEICDYHGENVYPLSTIFECIHDASLLHDDVLDNADVRRKKPSVNNLWGNYSAVLVGDYIFSKSSAVAFAANDFKFLKKIIESTTLMTEGQIYEFMHTGDWKTSREEYMEIISAKTAALISAACACGALVSDADEEKVRCLGQFGRNVGISFQLIDDLLDYTSSQEVFGKPVGKDFQEGKITLPLIYSLPRFDSTKRRHVEELLNSGEWTQQEALEVVDLVRKTGCLEDIRDEARAFGEKAEENLKEFPDSPAKRNLIELKQYVIDRDF